MTSATSHRAPDPLCSMYGAAAAVERADREGMELLLHDLYHTYTDFATLLMAMSCLTLDRLDAALSESDAQGAPLTSSERRSLAEQILGDAHAYEVTGAVAVHAAAQRLDSVRRWDAEQVAVEVDAARALTSDSDLLYGATALLTATLAVWADRTGRARSRAIRELCLASSAKH